MNGQKTQVITALGPNDPDDGDEGRQQRGLAIAAIADIRQNKLGYAVPSQSGNGHYQVSLADPEFCACPDYAARETTCKHLYAVSFVARRESDASGSTVENRSMRTSDWHSYDQAQINEGDHFVTLLRSLCDEAIEQPPQTNGRPKLPLSDVVFGMTLKVYSTMSTRRFMADLRGAEAKGLVDYVPSYATVCRYMEDPALTPLLKTLIERSALALSTVDVNFAPDSSGFATSVYHRWFDEKWQKTIKGATWVKAHIMTGVKSNIVTVADATSNKSADYPYFIPFVNTTAENFEVREVSADKAYLGKTNLRAVDDLGGVAYIPFKVNSIPHDGTPNSDKLWQRMYHYFMYNQDEFKAHYHLRSNVESTFSAVKRKFGGAVRSKTPVAQVNEVLCKILAHNIVVVIQAMYALGISATFGLDELVTKPSLAVAEISRN